MTSIRIPRDLRDYQLSIEWIERGEKSCLWAKGWRARARVGGERGLLGRQSRRVRCPTFSPTPANTESHHLWLLFHLFHPPHRLSIPSNGLLRHPFFCVASFSSLDSISRSHQRMKIYLRTGDATTWCTLLHLLSPPME